MSYDYYLAFRKSVKGQELVYVHSHPILSENAVARLVDLEATRARDAAAQRDQVDDDSDLDALPRMRGG